MVMHRGGCHCGRVRFEAEAPGVKSFYVPRSHPDAYSANARCLDAGTVARQRVLPFDGANWERYASELPPLTE